MGGSERPRPAGREVWHSPAKINLWLEIEGRLPDGMHVIDTCCQAIDLCDTVTLNAASDGGTLVCSVGGGMAAGVPEGADNLAARAAELLAERTGHDLRLALAIEKAIPAGAGLGGGSSDAAAVLLALGRRFAVPDPAHTLRDLARELGADVPFFLSGGTQLSGGAGEGLSPVEPPAEQWGVLVYPGVPVSTAWAYRAWGERGGGVPARCGEVVSDKAGTVRGAETRSRLPADWKTRGNAFEPIVLDRRPEVGRALGVLADGHAAVARMTGSGSAVFALYESADRRDRDLPRVQERIACLPDARLWPFSCVGYGAREVAALMPQA